ncbi:MAG: nicotinate-nucleotide adenylyltransferase [Prevotellaceae bacterium]|jgi:nicotinate-nucleotide adenylyltransferase|nr:nicotinate-nucleotide adenylyltransferase [Prevotellaceae bacterium]
MKTGLFFGSFNPIHIGHTALASYIVEQGLVDELWFVVSPHNPLKEKDGLLNAGLRLKMVQKAIEGYAKFRACDVEFSLQKPSYTIDTLRYLRENFPEKQFSVIMGADSLADINKWKDYKEILAEYDLLVYPRPNVTITDFPQNITILNNAPLLDISATFVREQLQKGHDVRYFVPNGVGELLTRDDTARP